MADWQSRSYVYLNHLEVACFVDLRDFPDQQEPKCNRSFGHDLSVMVRDYFGFSGRGQDVMRLTSDRATRGGYMCLQARSWRPAQLEKPCVVLAPAQRAVCEGADSLCST
eukprot:2260413-Amphidinium_carterae.1